MGPVVLGRRGVPTGVGFEINESILTGPDKGGRRTDVAAVVIATWVTEGDAVEKVLIQGHHGQYAYTASMWAVHVGGAQLSDERSQAT